MEPEFKYHDQKEFEYEKKLEELEEKLPRFVSVYFNSVGLSLTGRTRVAYAYDFINFFNFIKTSNPLLKNVSIREIDASILDELTLMDFDEYINTLKYNKKNKKKINKVSVPNRQIAALKSLYRVLYKYGIIEKNTASLLDKVKERTDDKKKINRLEAGEAVNIINKAGDGTGYGKRKALYREKNKTRDIAILTLLLGTGIRVSECVGIDISHINMEDHSIQVMRKGVKSSVVYFGESVKEALEAYLEERKNIKPAKGDEDALFLSMKKKRISVRMVQTLVHDYGKETVPMKKISPHTLRRTYGTELYRETGDLGLVSTALGHNDTNVTKRYADMSDEARREAAKHITYLDGRKQSE